MVLSKKEHLAYRCSMYDAQEQIFKIVLDFCRHFRLVDLVILLAGILLGSLAAARPALNRVEHICEASRAAARRAVSCVRREDGQNYSSDTNAPVKADPFSPAPRVGYLSWEEYFMAVAHLSAQRSKDPNKQVGACIVSQDNIILGIGYNGFPRGCSDDKLPWSKHSHHGGVLQTKYPYVCHAELNAVLNKNTANLRGATIYVTMFPCNECAKLLIQAGIVEVIYQEGKQGGETDLKPGPNIGIRPHEAYAASRLLFDLAHVRYRQAC